VVDGVGVNRLHQRQVVDDPRRVRQQFADPAAAPAVLAEGELRRAPPGTALWPLVMVDSRWFIRTESGRSRSKCAFQPRFVVPEIDLGRRPVHVQVDHRFRLRREVRQSRQRRVDAGRGRRRAARGRGGSGAGAVGHEPAQRQAAETKPGVAEELASGLQPVGIREAGHGRAGWIRGEPRRWATEPGWGAPLRRRRSGREENGSTSESAWGGRLGRSLALQGRRRFMRSVARQGLVEVQEQVRRERVGGEFGRRQRSRRAARRPPSPRRRGRRRGRRNTGPVCRARAPGGPRVRRAPGTARARSGSRTASRSPGLDPPSRSMRSARPRAASKCWTSFISWSAWRGVLLRSRRVQDCSRLGASKAAMNGGRGGAFEERVQAAAVEGGPGVLAGTRGCSSRRTRPVPRCWAAGRASRLCRPCP
jgi:hypothetical protein